MRHAQHHDLRGSYSWGYVHDAQRAMLPCLPCFAIRGVQLGYKSRRSSRAPPLWRRSRPSPTWFRPKRRLRTISSVGTKRGSGRILPFPGSSNLFSRDDHRAGPDSADFAHYIRLIRSRTKRSCTSLAKHERGGRHGNRAVRRPCGRAGHLTCVAVGGPALAGARAPDRHVARPGCGEDLLVIWRRRHPRQANVSRNVATKALRNVVRGWTGPVGRRRSRRVAPVA